MSSSEDFAVETAAPNVMVKLAAASLALAALFTALTGAQVLSAVDCYAPR